EAAHVLDLGCGPGNSAAMIRAAGHTVDAVDASSEMVRLANEKYAINARRALFDEIDGTDLYDAIWANFSLLHAPKAAFPVHLAALKTALKPGGLFHIGMKLGAGEDRDRIGRFYAYYGEEELADILCQAGFRDLQVDTGEAKGLAGSMDPFIIIRAHG
ncbi:MAG: class I SAM-dependent methyltransferase, partial [Litoreibacter sp.]|nr:class I SAM-dependent methyltransferase [Litoreibacter sp.]